MIVLALTAVCLVSIGVIAWSSSGEAQQPETPHHQHAHADVQPSPPRRLMASVGIGMLRVAHTVVKSIPGMPPSTLVAWRQFREAHDPAARPLPFEVLPPDYTAALSGNQPQTPTMLFPPANLTDLVGPGLKGSVHHGKGRRLAQMGRCITQCRPSVMLSVNMPFCGDVIDFFTCPVTLDGSTASADSYAANEYFSQLRSLPQNDECLVSFKAFSCYRYFPRCNSGQFFRMCRSTCNAFFGLCERSSGMVCGAFQGIAIDGDDCTGAAFALSPQRLLVLLSMLVVSLAMGMYV